MGIEKRWLGKKMQRKSEKLEIEKKIIKWREHSRKKQDRMKESRKLILSTEMKVEIREISHD